MITLKSGMPRNGKTLSVVVELRKLLEQWDKNPAKARPLYVFGITEFKLPCIPLEAWPIGGKPGDPIPLTAAGKPACKLAFDDGALPDGALVVIDEAQDFFPPRGPSQGAPPHVSALNTHGHRNLDFILCSQHPKLLDNAVRRLVNKHQHYRRAFGGGRAITYEWDTCSDALDFRSAIKGVFKYPSSAFGLYKSASGFVRPKFALPAFLIVPLLAIPVGIWAIPKAYHVMTGAVTGKGISERASVVPLASASAVFASSAVAASAPDGAPPVAVGAASAPAVLGCIKLGERCACIGDNGRFVPVEPGICEVSVQASGYAVPYAVRSTARGEGLRVSASPAAASEPRLGQSISLGGNPRSHILGPSQ